MEFEYGSGIQPHSRPGKYVIFCIGQMPAKIAAFKKWYEHNRLPVKALKGCYKGMIEDAFITTEEAYEKLKQWTLQQESILVLGESDTTRNRPATLVYHTGEKKPLGYLRACSKHQALSSDGWTYDPTIDTYFICD